MKEINKEKILLSVEKISSAFADEILEFIEKKKQQKKKNSETE